MHTSAKFKGRAQKRPRQGSPHYAIFAYYTIVAFYKKKSLSTKNIIFHTKLTFSRPPFFTLTVGICGKPQGYQTLPISNDKVSEYLSQKSLNFAALNGQQTYRDF